MTDAPAGGQSSSRNFLLIAAALVAFIFASHLAFLNVSFYWDELGQFVPAALDIFQKGEWIPRSTVPNVHPPGVMAYLAGVWLVAGYSIAATRVAMLALAAAGAVATLIVYSIYIVMRQAVEKADIARLDQLRRERRSSARE